MNKLSDNKKIYEWLIVGKTFSANVLLGFLFDHYKKNEKSLKNIAWVSGSGSHFSSAVNAFDAAEAAPLVLELCERLSIPLEAHTHASSVLEFKNKVFREAFWRKGLKARESQEFHARIADLWFPERAAIQFEEVTFTRSIDEIHQKIEKLLLGQFTEFNETINQVIEISENKNEDYLEVKFASGASAYTKKMIYADHLVVNARNVYSLWQSQSKQWSFLKKGQHFGVLQVRFTHGGHLNANAVFSEKLGYSFFGPVNRDSGETFDRNVWGYFFKPDQGEIQSSWSIFLTSEEAESNHIIAKKIRKLKQALEKMFGDYRQAGVGGNSEESSKENSFVHSISNEQVCLENSVLVEGLKLEGPEKNIYRTIIDNSFYLVTEALGLSTSLKQCASLLRKLEYISDDLTALNRGETQELKHLSEELNTLSDQQALLRTENLTGEEKNNASEWHEQLA